MMPNIDGYELAERIQANPQTKFIPVIMQTAAEFLPADMRRGSEAGALGFITDTDPALEWQGVLTTLLGSGN